MKTILLLLATELCALCVVAGCEIYGRKPNGNALDLSLRIVSSPTINNGMTTLRQKAGFNNKFDGLFVSAGYRFGLK